MAGAWLKVEKDTPEKPEILAIASLMGMDPDMVFGKCFKVWRWFDSNSADGAVSGIPAGLLDNLVHTAGFTNALITVGWLKVREGSLLIPHFDRHMGQSAKKRVLSNDRMKRSRRKKCCAARVTKAQHALILSSLSSVPLKEEQCSEAKKEPGIPVELDTIPFRDAWTEWIKYRAEKRKKVSARAKKTQLEFLASLGPEKAVASIAQSIRNDWQGLFDPAPNGHGKIGSETVAERRARVDAEMKREEEEFFRCSSNNGITGNDATAIHSAS